MLRFLTLLALFAAAAATVPISPSVVNIVEATFPHADNVARGVEQVGLVPMATTIVGSTVNAEFIKFIPNSDGLVVVCNDGDKKMDVFKLQADGRFVPVHSILTGGMSPQSVTYSNGVLAIALDNGARGPVADSDPVVHQHGAVWLFDVADLESGSADDACKLDAMGYLPDHVSFSTNGMTLNVAIEAEPAGDGSYDAPGGVTVFKATGAEGFSDCNSISGTFVSLDVFDGSEADLLKAGVHMPFYAMPGAPGTTTASQALEPEYITYSADGTVAYVAMQEASAIAVLDLDTMQWSKIMALGMKSLEVFAHDVSNKDSPDGLGDTYAGNFQTFTGAYEMFQPDTIHSFTGDDGKLYIVTANEGDSQDYDFATEEGRFGDIASLCNSTALPECSAWNDDQKLKRYKVTLSPPIGFNGASYSKIVGYGGRSVSIWDAETGTLVWDQGANAERLMYDKAYTTRHFNSEGDAVDIDDRSDDKGPEIEGLALAKIGGSQYMFVAAERASVIYVYDITTPTAPVFLHLAAVHDCSLEPAVRTSLMKDPESLEFIPANMSPSGAAYARGLLHVHRLFGLLLPGRLQEDRALCERPHRPHYATPSALRLIRRVQADQAQA
ncbi:hypothetical protein T492DRAFT_900902 [Pavlovales sp. CCMP2436]|nr:hypothetical protein T492DRAFT_900902 [Pavlovales sp. CCMP2436]